jgi:hypothetical protein
MQTRPSAATVRPRRPARATQARAVRLDHAEPRRMGSAYQEGLRCGPLRQQQAQACESPLCCARCHSPMNTIVSSRQQRASAARGPSSPIPFAAQDPQAPAQDGKTAPRPGSHFPELIAPLLLLGPVCVHAAPGEAVSGRRCQNHTERPWVSLANGEAPRRPSTRRAKSRTVVGPLAARRRAASVAARVLFGRRQDRLSGRRDEDPRRRLCYGSRGRKC